MKICSVNAPCLASFLMIVLTVHATTFKSELTNEEANLENLEWKLQHNKPHQNRMIKSNSSEHGKKSVNMGSAEHNENKNATKESPETIFRTIFDVLHKNKECPKGQKVDQTGNCREEFGPNSK
ncbi:uncharacterized protein LOC143422598 [Xylocopa sonorina]|uniref:uncharacterized protein LOC143422598 n=1 Tax=Xylocopa sonorina TaxID=1818115 RepID=UPI00403ABA99